jgi:hypothetical protein
VALQITKIDPKTTRAWKEVITRLSRLNDKALMLKMLDDLYGLEVDFAAQTRSTIPFIDRLKLPRLVAEIDQIKRAARAVQEHELGVQLQKNGDIDIVAPNWYTREKIDGLLGGWIIPVLLATGILIIGGLIYGLKKMESDTDELTKKYNSIVRATDKTFCAEPSSQKCAAWLDLKNRERFEERKGIIDKMGDTLGALGSGAKTGAKIGLAVLIPLTAIYLFAGQKNG